MKPKIQALTLADGERIFVALSPLDIEPAVSTSAPTISDLPTGAEPTSFGLTQAVDAMQQLQGTITSMAQTVHDSLKQVGPKEWQVELTFGFAGNGGIPFIASGEVQGGVKVTAKWEKET